MPRRKFDKKHATTYALVHRPQNDPLIHDEDAPDMVFKAVESSGSKRNRARTRGDLEDEFGLSFRANEGQAANYGIYYDDTEYDYMQHMAESGAGGDAVFVEALPTSQKHKIPLEDALRTLEPDTGVFKDANKAYQSQQDVPDDIAGFQPDMDPRLREVLEALDDDAYVDDEEQIFAELAKGGEELDTELWEQSVDAFDDGWESDDTVKAGVRPQEDSPADWTTEFAKYKTATKARSNGDKLAASSEVQSNATGASSILGGRRKKRKGALTSSTNYSMTSSALARTDELTTLDERFDRLVEDYAHDDDEDYEFDDDASMASGLTDASNLSKASMRSNASKSSEQVSQRSMADLNSLVDDFLGSYSAKGKKGRVSRGKQQSGLEQLQELRQELGPARLTQKDAATAI